MSPLALGWLAQPQNHPARQCLVRKRGSDHFRDHPTRVRARMAKYKVNDEGVALARTLIDDSKVDTETNWSDAAPSTDEENDKIDQDGYRGYGKWHLAIDTEASEETKSRYGFPYGDFSKVNRAALIHAKQRASQNDHDDVVEAADRLLEHLDDTTG